MYVPPVFQIMFLKNEFFRNFPGENHQKSSPRKAVDLGSMDLRLAFSFHPSPGVPQRVATTTPFLISLDNRHLTHDQWLFLVPVKGGLGSIFHPPEGKDYKWYIIGIFPANWRIFLATYLPPFTGTKNDH